MERACGSKNTLLIVLLILSVLTFFSSCDDDDDDDDSSESGSDDDDNADDDDDNDDNDMADTTTSASPARESALLTQDHSGYMDADCSSCHDSPHLSGFKDGECATCHGGNGAPDRPFEHADEGCTDCHTASHVDLNFNDPHHCTACHGYEPVDGCAYTEDYDVVVIGAGGGGLSAAAALALGGKSVVVLEKHYRVGGYMATFKRLDYNFEVSLHALNDAETGENFERIDILDRLNAVKTDPIYRSVFPNHDVFIPADPDEYKADLKQWFPDQEDGIEALFTELETMYVVLEAALGVMNDFNMEDLTTLLTNIDATLRLASYLFMDLQTFMETYVDDQELIAMFTQLCTFIGGAPSDLQTLFFNSMWNSYHTKGYFYPEGGSGALAGHMADVIEENGGVIKLNNLVTKIVVQGNRATQVQTANGSCFNADYVVSNANAPDTIFKLVGEENWPADYVQDVEQMEIGVAILQVFMGVDKDYIDQFNDTHEIMVNESYDWEQAMIDTWEGRAELTPYILVNYSVVDSTAAPAGKNSIVISTFMPYDWEDTWRWNGDYDPYIDLKEQVANVYIERAEQFLPGLSDHIEVLEVGSPVTMKAFTNNPQGAVYGWINDPAHGTLRRLSQETPIENLYLAGAWTFPGGGQATVIQSGIAAADIILGDN